MNSWRPVLRCALAFGWMGALAAGCGSTTEGTGGTPGAGSTGAGSSSGETSGSSATGSGAPTSGSSSGTSSAGAESGEPSDASTGSSSGTSSGESSGESSGSASAGATSGASSGESSGASRDDGGTTMTDSGWGTPVDGGPPFAGPTVDGTVKVTPGMKVGHVGAGFLGFSFEKTHMTDNFFTGTNAPLIAIFKLLGPGVVRIGANDVDRTTWQANAMPVSGPPFPHVVGSVEVDGLAAFLTATGWKAIYGVDYKMGTPANDAMEAGYVATKLGDSLSAFEIGNEIDRGPPTYSNASWESFVTAIRAAAPNARFAGPATDPGASAFAATFAKSEASRIVLITHHYYGQGARTMAAMLAPDPKLVTILDTIATAATSNQIEDG